MTVKTKAPEPPLGVVGALVAGFETVNARLELILLPLLLDLFLWLGPRFSVHTLVANVVADLNSLVEQTVVDAATRASFTVLSDMLVEYGRTFNVFSVLSTAPVGLPSLMAGRAPGVFPGGTPLVWDLPNPLIYVALTLVFSFMGLFIGALYFGGIAQQVRDTRLNLGQLARQVWGDWAQILIVVFFWLLLILLGGLPLLLLSGLLSLISPMVGSLFSLLGSMVGVWVFIYMGFTLHGIILQRRNLFFALWDSLQLVHRNLAPTASLFASILIVSAGLGFVWNIPADDSWLLVIGIAGHALVSTALIAATFTFYKDRYRWWQEMKQWVATQPQRRVANSK